jgi:hypothetical protein
MMLDRCAVEVSVRIPPSVRGAWVENGRFMVRKSFQSFSKIFYSIVRIAEKCGYLCLRDIRIAMLKFIYLHICMYIYVYIKMYMYYTSLRVQRTLACSMSAQMSRRRQYECRVFMFIHASFQVDVMYTLPCTLM